MLRSLQQCTRPGATILTYHRVVDSLAIYPRGHPFSGLVVGKNEFAHQLEYLRDNYQIITLSDLADRIGRAEDTSRCVVITFDDGYLDNLTNALPLLERYQAAATIFVTTGLVNRSASLWWFELEYLLAGQDRLYAQIADYATKLKGLDLSQQSELLGQLRRNQRLGFSYDQMMLTWEQVSMLAAHPLITIGAHTVSHAVLARLSATQLESELSEGRQQLEDKIGKKVDLFSYPYGSIAEAAAREYAAVSKCGYRAAVTTIEAHCGKASLNALPRISVDCCDTLVDFAWKLSGFYAARLKAI